MRSAQESGHVIEGHTLSMLSKQLCKDAPTSEVMPLVLMQSEVVQLLPAKCPTCTQQRVVHFGARGQP